MSTSLLRPLGFGEILDGGFSLYRRHFAVLFTTALIAMAPLSLASGLWMRTTMTGDPASAAEAMTSFAWYLPLMFFMGIVMVIGWGALTRQLGQAIDGREVSVGDGYRAGLRRFASVVAAGVAAYAAIFVGFMLLMLLAGLVAGLTVLVGGEAGALVITAIVAVASIVLLLAFTASFFAVVPAVVLEGSGPLSALRRSWRLARGARLRILGIGLVSWLIVMLPWTGVMFAAGMGAAIYDADAVARLSTSQFLVQQVVGVLSGSLTFPFWVGCLTLLYYDRRVRTEAYDLEAATEKLALAS